nr:MAG TPA_asm: hypothetical protein [Caudoviricetes sp.]
MQEDNNKDICSALILYFYLLLQVAVLPQGGFSLHFCKEKSSGRTTGRKGSYDFPPNERK